MSERTRQSAIQVAGLIVMFAVLFNVAFYFLAELYFEERAAKYGIQELAGLPGARRTFAMFTVVVAVAGALSAHTPRWTGHGLAALGGLGALVAAFYAWSAGLQGTLIVTLGLVGVLLPVLAVVSLRGSRAAWSFLVALCGVLALILVFGAPKVRGLVGIGLWIALIIPGLLAVATTALSTLDRDYREA